MPIRFHRIVGRVQARGVDDPKWKPVHLHRLVQGVAGRARHLGHDCPLPADQAVEQARLAHVGPVPQSRPRTPRAAGCRARPRRGPPPPPGGPRRAAPKAALRAGPGPPRPGNRARPSRKVRISTSSGHRGVDPFRERPVQRAPGEPRRLAGRGIDEVRHRLGLGEVELAVEERALREPRPAGPDAPRGRTPGPPPRSSTAGPP